jgi:hypothetical protein
MQRLLDGAWDISAVSADSCRWGTILNCLRYVRNVFNAGNSEENGQSHFYWSTSWYWMNGYILPTFQFRLWYWCIRSCNQSHYFSTFFSDVNSNCKLRFYWSVSKLVTEWKDILPTFQFRLWLVSNTAAIKWIWIWNSVFVDQFHVIVNEGYFTRHSIQSVIVLYLLM